MRGVVHGTGLARIEIAAAVVGIDRGTQDAAAHSDRRGRQRGALAHEYRDGASDQPRADAGHLSVAAGRDPASRTTWMDDEVDGPLVQAATTPSEVTASAG